VVAGPRFGLWRRNAGGAALLFLVVLGLRAFVEGFVRDPRTSPLVRLDDVVFSLGIVVPVVVVMAARGVAAESRRRPNG
jgi:hypothetical protein